MYHHLKRRAIATLRSGLALAAIGAVVSAGPQPAGATARFGGSLTQGVAARPIDRVLDALPRVTRTEVLKLKHVPRPANGLTDAQYAALKARVAGRQLVATAAGSARSIAPARAEIASETPVARSFNGIDETCSGLTPSDMGLAAGTAYVVQAVNSCIGIYSKTGVLQTGYPKSLNALFGLPSGAFTFDPRAQYDWHNLRYTVTAETLDFSSGAGSIYVAVSATSDPRGAWHVYNFPFGVTGSSAPDFPSLGQDQRGIYIAANIFGFSGGNFTSFQGNAMLLLSKAAMYRGLGFSYYGYSNLSANGLTLDSLQPVNISDRDSNPRAEFVMASFNITAGGGQCSNDTCNGIVVFALANPLVASGSPGPELSGLIVPTAHNYGLPPGARQFGGAALVDTGDTRIGGSTAYAAGNLYGALNTLNTAGQTSVLWFEIHPTLNDGNSRCSGRYAYACADISGASIVNEDCFFCGGYGTNGSSFYGTLQPDPEGNVTMVYAFSDDNNYPGLAYVSRRTTQLANTMHDNGIFAASGGGSYTQGRWGDYSGVSLDQSTSAVASKWFSGMHSLANGNWGTGIGYNGFLLPTQP